MASKGDKPRLGRGLSSLIGKPVAVGVDLASARTMSAVPKPVGAVAGAEAQAASNGKPAAAVPSGAAPQGHGTAAPAPTAAGGPGSSAAVVPAPASSAQAAVVVNSGGSNAPAVPRGTAAESISGRGIEIEPIGRLVQLDVERLVPGRFQPRREMDEASLRGLAESIRASGVMQPLAVRMVRSPSGEATDRFEIVAGERRWRAAKLAGLRRVPAVVSALTDREAAEWAVVENLQREDLNTMERAWGLRNLVEAFGLGHADVAERIGLERSSVSNMIRLTELETSIQALLRSGALGMGHGKALLGAPAGAGREKLAALSASQKWSVRRLERAAGALAVEKEMPSDPAKAGTGGASSARLGGASAGDPLRADAAIRELERQLGEHLGTRVRIATGASRTKGRIMIDFYSLEHFDGLMGQMGVEISS